MPAFRRPSSQARPETDYERWMRDRDSNFKLSDKPQYGPEELGSNQNPIVEDSSSVDDGPDSQFVLKDQRTQSPAQIDLHRNSTKKFSFSVWYPRIGETAINLITVLMVLGVLFFVVWIIRARRRPVRRALGVISIREKRNV
ncbi:hypothetical protein BBP40_003584 [Aspergillus hancockii]|nr:hypothetical protein BBP40_003584 [Aspergillus hancockii]